MTLTVAIESLHKAYPGQYITGVNCLYPLIFHNNPYVTRLSASSGVRLLEMHYPTIERSNQTSTAFINGYTEHLASELGVKITPVSNRPILYLEDKEKEWVSQIQELAGKNIPYWLVNAGIKSDYTTKSWPVEYYQRVVDITRNSIQWVQIGHNSDSHPELKNVINLVGKTDIRQLIRLAYHCSGGLGPVTFLQHLCAAWEKPYLCLSGGREPLPWISYPLQHTFHTMGMLDCCKKESCWKSRVQAKGDMEDAKNKSLCELPVLGASRISPRCMYLITPDEVATTLRKFV